MKKIKIIIGAIIAAIITWLGTTVAITNSRINELNQEIAELTTNIKAYELENSALKDDTIEFQYTIEQLNPAFLENICTVQNCKKCGKDLTSTGIVTKMKTEYDNESNSFITSKKSFHCAECDTELTDYQVNYFKL